MDSANNPYRAPAAQGVREVADAPLQWSVVEAVRMTGRLLLRHPLALAGMGLLLSFRDGMTEASTRWLGAFADQPSLHIGLLMLAALATMVASAFLQTGVVWTLLRLFRGQGLALPGVGWFFRTGALLAALTLAYTLVDGVLMCTVIGWLIVSPRLFFWNDLLVDGHSVADCFRLSWEGTRGRWGTMAVLLVGFTLYSFAGGAFTERFDGAGAAIVVVLEGLAYGMLLLPPQVALYVQIKRGLDARLAE